MDPDLRKRLDELISDFEKADHAVYVTVFGQRESGWGAVFNYHAEDRDRPYRKVKS